MERRLCAGSVLGTREQGGQGSHPPDISVGSMPSPCLWSREEEALRGRWMGKVPSGQDTSTKGNGVSDFFAPTRTGKAMSKTEFSPLPQLLAGCPLKPSSKNKATAPAMTRPCGRSNIFNWSSLGLGWSVPSWSCQLSSRAPRGLPHRLFTLPSCE